MCVYLLTEVCRSEIQSHSRFEFLNSPDSPNFEIRVLRPICVQSCNINVKEEETDHLIRIPFLRFGNFILFYFIIFQHEGYSMSSREIALLKQHEAHVVKII